MTQKKNGKTSKSAFTTTLLDTKNIPDGSRKTVQMSRTDKKTMTYNDIQLLVNGIQNNLPKPGTKVVVKGMNADGLKTLKGYDTELKTEDEVEDYYNAYAKEGGNMDKFKGFYNIQLQFLIPDDNNNDDFFL
jgi:hypothetical protein